MDILIHYLQLHCRQSEFMIVKTYLLIYLLTYLDSQLPPQLIFLKTALNKHLNTFLFP